MVHHPLRSNDIRESNEKLVLNLIFRNGGTSQSQIVQQTGLKAPTVFRIFAKLESEGLIQPCHTDGIPDEPRTTERKGRRPNYYCVEPASGYAIGVDFSRLAASVIVVDFGNQVIHHEACDLELNLPRDGILHVLEELIARAIAASGITAEQILGIGIAAPGVVNTDTGTVLEYERIEGLGGYAIGAHFEQRFDAPVLVHNNASVIASSAYHYGAAQEENSLLAVLVRSGVGGALVNHGEVFLNGPATALEIGRMRPFPDSSESMESIVSEPAMLALLQERFGVTSWSEAQEQLTLEQITPVLHRAAEVFAATLHNLHHLFHPEAILLISRYPLLGEMLQATTEAVLPNERVISLVYDPVQACYGATDMVFKQFFRLSPSGV